MLMKKFCFFPAITVFLLCVVSSSVYAQRNALAIFNLKATNIEAMGYNGEILHALISSIESNKDIDLMPRREIEEVLFKTGLVQDNTHEAVLAAGKALGINFVLFGDVTKKGSEIITRLSLMDIEHKGIVKNWDLIFRDRDSILQKVPEFSRDLSSTLINRKSGDGAASMESQTSTDVEYLNAKIEGDAVRLSWKLRTHKTSVNYNVYRAESKDGPYQFLGKTADSFFQDSTVKKGLTYFYRIGIIAGTDPEVKSSHTALFINAGEKRPHPPLVMSGRGYVKRTEIKFVPSLKNEQDKFNIIKYKIYRQKGPDEWGNIGTIDSKDTSQFDIGFTVFDESNFNDGTTYTYAIASIDDKGLESPLSDPISIDTIKNPVLSLDKDNLLRKVFLSWKPIENVAGYYLYRKSDKAEWKKVGSISGGTKTNIIDEKDLADGPQYTYYLTAYDDKNETGPSNEVKGKTKDLPAFPLNLQVRSGLVKSVNISWNPLDDTDVGGYNIYRGLDNNNMKKIASVKDYKSNTYLDKGEAFISLDDGKNYFYAITSFNLFETDGKVSPCVKAATKPRPASVNGLSASAGADHILIGWERNPETDIKSNVVYRSISGGGAFSTLSGGSWSRLTELSMGQISYKDFDLKPESSYSYRIISEDKDGLKSDPADSNQVASPIVKQEKSK
jgi:fibronectin type 3 domain-containing protein